MNPSDSTILNSDLSSNITEAGSNIVETSSNIVEASSSIAEALHNEVEDVVIEKGATLLGLYEVKSDPIAGGMGQVFRVHHTGWDADLAMKQPKAELFQNERQKENFIHECEAWINLGLHPHIVSCYYVREINGIPSIFAEWMDGGSLKDTIKNEKLYEGDALPRILDIAIQFARGLHYAHEQWLIHQDVKPDNLLLSLTGEAKVADFGLARTRAKLTLVGNTEPPASDDGMMYFTSGGYTPAYCSMEQLNGEKLTRRTDIYSWAVTVLEMFIGERKWKSGIAAGIACEDYFQMEQRVPIPESMKALLRHCFKENEAERPHDFLEVEKTLLEIYENETGNAYSRISPKAAADTADSLNNRALSFLDLGRPKEAEELWDIALKITSNHAESLYNQGIHLWRNAKIDDDEVILRLSKNRTEATDYYMAKAHLSRGDADSAIELLGKAQEAQGETSEIKRAMAAAIEMKEQGKSVRCLKTFYNPGADSFCISPNGKTILSRGSYQLALWDIASEQHLKTFNIVPSAMCLSPDGKTVASGEFLKYEINLWSTATGKCIKTIEGHKNIISSVCFSPDGKKLLSRSESDVQTLKLWDVYTGECLSTFQNFNERTYSACFSPDGKTILTSSYKKPLKLWDAVTGKPVRKFDKSEDRGIFTACFSPDGKTILSCGGNGIEIWDAATGKYLREYITGHLGGVDSVKISENGKMMLSSGQSDNKIKLWNMETEQCLWTFENMGHNYCFNSDGKSIVISMNNTVKIWSMPEKQSYEMAQNKISATETVLRNTSVFDSLVEKTKEYLNKGDIANAVPVLMELKQKQSFGNRRIYLTLKKQIARYCDMKYISDDITVKSLSHDASSVCYSPDGKSALSGSRDSIKMWDTETWECINEFKETCHKAVFSPCGKMIAVVNSNIKDVIKLLDAVTGECLKTFSGHKDGTTSIRFNPDGKTLLTSSSLSNTNRVATDGTLKLWDIETGKCISTFGNYRLSVEDICFSSDGNKIIKCGLRWSALYVDIIDTKTKSNIKTLSYASPAYSVCFSQNNKSVLVGRYNLAMQLWDVETVKCIREYNIRNLHGDITVVCFSPNGKYAISGNYKIMDLWNVETAQRIYSYERPNGANGSACFSPDGTQILASLGREVVLFDLDYDLIFPGFKNWDDGALPYAETFLTLYPDYTGEDFDRLIIELQNRGYGWLRPEGVKIKLDELQFGW